MNIYLNISTNLAWLLAEQGKNRNDIATGTGMSASTANRVLKAGYGNANITIKSISQISRYLGVDDWVLMLPPEVARKLILTGAATIKKSNKSLPDPTKSD